MTKKIDWSLYVIMLVIVSGIFFLDIFETYTFLAISIVATCLFFQKNISNFYSISERYKKEIRALGYLIDTIHKDKWNFWIIVLGLSMMISFFQKNDFNIAKLSAIFSFFFIFQIEIKNFIGFYVFRKKVDIKKSFKEMAYIFYIGKIIIFIPIISIFAYYLYVQFPIEAMQIFAYFIVIFSIFYFGKDFSLSKDKSFTKYKNSEIKKNKKKKNNKAGLKKNNNKRMPPFGINNQNKPNIDDAAYSSINTAKQEVSRKKTEIKDTEKKREKAHAIMAPKIK